MRVSSKVISTLEVYKREILEERNRQAEIKKKYGIKSLEYLIDKLDIELITLYGRKDAGENVDLAIRNKVERKSEYEKALKELEILIQKEKTLTMSMPKLIGIIRVKPYVNIEQSLRSDALIEAIGMEVAMKYERDNGREPEDVSSQNLGFDIRFFDNSGKIRYIEVKARAVQGEIVLTQNEWFKSQNLGDDYYLYVVFNTSKSPTLHIIQNPAEKLNVMERIEMVRYFVDAQEIVNYTSDGK